MGTPYLVTEGIRVGTIPASPGALTMGTQDLRDQDTIPGIRPPPGAKITPSPPGDPLEGALSPWGPSPQLGST